MQVKNSKLCKRLAAMFGGVVVGAFATLEAANAAIDTSVSTALQAVQTDAGTLNGIVTPIIISVLGMFIVIKLIKKFGNKI